jgi:hypothetical protein
MTGPDAMGLRTHAKLGPRPIGNWVGGPWESRSPLRTVFIDNAVWKSGRHPGGLK